MSPSPEPPPGGSSPAYLPDIVRLVWDGDPYCWYVYGHVADELAVASVRGELLDDLDDLDEDDEPPELAVTRRTHARWQWPNASDDEIPGNGYTLAVSAQGRGAFKVTVVRRVADIERDRAYRQELRERPEKAIAAFKSLFPEATDARWHILGDGTAPDLGEVRARFPGLVDEVRWRFDHPEWLHPTHEEADALRAWLADRRARRAAEASEAESGATSDAGDDAAPLPSR